MPMSKKSAPSKKAAAPAKRAVHAAKAAAKPARYVVLDTPLRSERYPTIGQGFAKAA